MRRAGPNYQEGLRAMRQLGENLGVPIFVHGPEMFITGIGKKKKKNIQRIDYLSYVVPIALGIKPALVHRTSNLDLNEKVYSESSSVSSSSSQQLNGQAPSTAALVAAAEQPPSFTSFDTSAAPVDKPKFSLFSNETRAFVYGMQPRAVQGMLDFDHVCGRKRASVAGMIYPFGGSHVQKFYWGTNETLVPVFTKAITRPSLCFC